MLATSTCLRIALAVGACCFLLGPAMAEGLPSTDAQQIEREIQDLDYQVSWQATPDLKDVETSWQAPNRAQGIRTYFTGDGLRVFPRLEAQAAPWQVGFSLIGYGRDATSSTPRRACPGCWNSTTPKATWWLDTFMDWAWCRVRAAA